MDATDNCYVNCCFFIVWNRYSYHLIYLKWCIGIVIGKEETVLEDLYILSGAQNKQNNMILAFYISHQQPCSLYFCINHWKTHTGRSLLSFCERKYVLKLLESFCTKTKYGGWNDCSNPDTCHQVNSTDQPPAHCVLWSLTLSFYLRKNQTGRQSDQRQTPETEVRTPLSG